MDGDGNTREDIKAPEGEIAEKIAKFEEEGKDMSEYIPHFLQALCLMFSSRHCLEGHG